MRSFSRILFVALFLFLAALFVRFGVWQLDRAAQSKEITAMVKRRSTLPPVAIGDALQRDEGLVYRDALAEGQFEPGGRILIDGKKHNGRLGYHEIVPFHLAGSDVRLLVNRGWVPNARKAPTEPNPGHVQGVIARPQVPPLQLASRKPSGEGPWPYLDLKRYQRAYGYPVAPFVLIEDETLAEQTRKSGLGRANKWGMHIGYAIQWFVFAVLAGVLSVIVIRRNRRMEP